MNRSHNFRMHYIQQSILYNITHFPRMILLSKYQNIISRSTMFLGDIRYSKMIDIYNTHHHIIPNSLDFDHMSHWDIHYSTQSHKYSMLNHILQRTLLPIRMFPLDIKGHILSYREGNFLDILHIDMSTRDLTKFSKYRVCPGQGILLNLSLVSIVQCHNLKQRHTFCLQRGQNLRSRR